MRITFKLGEPLWRTVGKREVAVDVPPSATVGHALTALATTYPAAGQELHSRDGQADFYYSLFVNDRLVPFANKDQVTVKDGDVITILLPLAGG